MWKTWSRSRKSRRNRTNDSRRHTESGPPLTHTSTRSPGVNRSCARAVFVTRSRTLATAGGLRAAIGLPRDASDPAIRIGHLARLREMLARLPHQVEAAHAHPFDHVAHESLAGVVLRHLLIESDRTLESLLDAANVPSRLEGVPESGKGRDVFLPHLVHHEGGVPFQERHHRLGPFEDRALLRRQQSKDPARSAPRSRLLGRATKLIHQLVGIQRNRLEVLVHHPAEERAEPRR